MIKLQVGSKIAPREGDVYTYIKELPEGLRVMAIENAKRSNPDIDPNQYLEMTIMGAFSWSRTPEGVDFWKKVVKGEIEDFQKKKITLRFKP